MDHLDLRERKASLEILVNQDREDYVDQLDCQEEREDVVVPEEMANEALQDYRA